ncbi:MAG: LLM class F420-dependent oxidoreductase [Acidimicrobiia bacterium]
MKLDIHVSRFDWPGGTSAISPTLVDLSRTAEQLGIGTLSFMDHFFQMDWMAPATDPMLEGYTALGFVAGVTTKLRLRLLVTGVTYRHPGLLAKTVTTLDVLSQGRAELGIGAAWYEREHVGLGVPFPSTKERFERLEEAINICLQMWEGNAGTFEGKHYRLAEMICSPPPVSRPRPRIMIGGSGERKTLRMVAQYADACNIFGTADVVAHKVDVLRRHCDDLGRDINTIEITAMLQHGPGSTRDDILKEAQSFADIGVATMVTRPGDPEPVRALEDTFAPVMDDLAAIRPKPL